ncbi:MAG: tetratricopeptide repeat protein, partial [Myxococcota bacterium]
EPGLCAAASAAIDSMWTGKRKYELRRAFAATGLSFAASTWNHVESQVDEYVSAWRDAAVSACTATHIERTQSEELLDRRRHCLERRRSQLAAVLDRLQHADALIVAHALDAIPDPSVLNICSHVPTLEKWPTPPDAHQAEPVSRIAGALDDARAARLLGNHEDAATIARAQEPAAASTGYGPIIAEAHFEVAFGLLDQGGPAGAVRAREKLDKAELLAESSNHDELLAHIRTQRIFTAYMGDRNTESGRKWYVRADAALRSIADPVWLRIKALRFLALLDYRDGDWQNAAKRQREALNQAAAAEPDASSRVRYISALLRQDLGNTLRQQYKLKLAKKWLEKARDELMADLGEDHPRVVEVDFDLASLHYQHEQLAEAETLMRQVIARHRDSVGADHWLVGKAMLELAEILRMRGALTQAKTLAESTLDVYRASYPPEHRLFSQAYNRLGAIHYQLGEYEDAEARYRKVLALVREYEEPDHLDLGLAQANLAEVLVAKKRWREALEAIEAAEKTKMNQNKYLRPFLFGVRGQAELGLDRIPKAIDHLEQAVEGYGKSNTEIAKADALWALARARDRQAPGGDRAQALIDAEAARALYKEQRGEVITPSREIQQWLNARRDTREN